MNTFRALLLVAMGLISTSAMAVEKTRLFVVSSYHKEYLWSQSTQEGLVAAMLDHGYLDNAEQGQTLTDSDYTESATAVVKKVWMNTKRKNSKPEMAAATAAIMEQIHAFKPDVVLLGDDNAANYIGNQLLDTETPVVFWGINGLPLKYGLVDKLEEPGHNVTGVWQAGYHKESVELLHELVPEAKTFAIIGCDSVSARPKVKQIESLARQGKLPLALVGSVVTNSFPEFKEQVLALADQVDAFFVLNHDTMRDENGQHVDMLIVGRWYLENINLPAASHEGQFVREGMLATANDSGFNQSYRAFEMAHDILANGMDPGQIRSEPPKRGPFMVNRIRAEMLGISLDDKLNLIDEMVEEAVALEDSAS